MTEGDVEDELQEMLEEVQEEQISTINEEMLEEIHDRRTSSMDESVAEEEQFHIQRKTRQGYQRSVTGRFL